MSNQSFKIPLFYPHVTLKMRRAAYQALGQKIIAQGRTVANFEAKLSSTLGFKYPVAVNSGTSALELAYTLMGLGAKDEVIVPVFTFAATTLPLLRRGVKIVFADVGENMLLNWDDAISKITPHTRAIVNVHLFDQLSQPRQVEVPIIGDAAQYLGKTQGERFTAYSFQATKMLTTVDGGALACQRQTDYNRAKLLRWYGIDRKQDQDNAAADIREVGFKYNMNNVTAAMGLAALPQLPKWKTKIRKLQQRYREGLADVPGIKVIGGSPFLIHTNNRTKLVKHLGNQGIETGLGFKRNDAYTVFGGKRLNLPNMNRLETIYLLLPCRANMLVSEVDYVCHAIASQRK